jgi:hypothetical protein
MSINIGQIQISNSKRLVDLLASSTLMVSMTRQAVPSASISPPGGRQMQGGFTPNIRRRMRQPRRDGIHPIDDGSAMKPSPPQKLVVPRFNLGIHSTFRNVSILFYGLALTALFFSFFIYEGNIAYQIVSAGRCVMRTRLARSAKKKRVTAAAASGKVIFS